MAMKIEYDPIRDLLYLWFATPGEKAARTATIAPGVHADFNAEEKLIGIEVLDASEVLGKRASFELELSGFMHQGLDIRPTATTSPN
jgi:uncharacterized protein YuzE